MDTLSDIGYALSTEEHPPLDLVRNAQRAERAGFGFAYISDHYHPWIDRQGHSPFVWSVIGAIATATESLELGTGVTCPTFRIHPAIIAQAAATSAAMMPGRFTLGIGTGENLNEHVLGDRWPPYDLRAEMLEEAVEIIRTLWTGETITFYGDFYIVEEARLYTLPDIPPAIYMAASGPKSAALAGSIADGFISTSPDPELVQIFRENGGQGLECDGQLTLCYAPTREQALEKTMEYWPNAALRGEISQELRTPTHFEQAVKIVSEQDLPEGIVLGSEVDQYLQGIEKFKQAGFDRVYLHHIGPDQEDFFRFFEDELGPEL